MADLSMTESASCKELRELLAERFPGFRVLFCHRNAECLLLLLLL